MRPANTATNIRVQRSALWAVKIPPPWTPDNPDYQWLTARHGNSIPSLLVQRHHYHDAIGAPLIQWHTVIYRTLADGTYLGRHWKRRHTYELADAIEAVCQLAPPHTPGRTRNAINTFYTRLLASDLLDHQRGGTPMTHDWDPQCHLCGNRWSDMNDTPPDNPAERGWNVDEDGTTTCCDCEWLITTGALPTTTH